MPIESRNTRSIACSHLIFNTHVKTVTQIKNGLSTRLKSR